MTLFRMLIVDGAKSCAKTYMFWPLVHQALMRTYIKMIPSCIDLFHLFQFLS